MNIQQSAQTLNEFLAQLTDLHFGDQYYYKHGTSALNALLAEGPKVSVNELIIPNSDVRAMLSEHIRTGEPHGYEFGRINKTAASVTTYTVALFLLDNGYLLATRPHRNTMSFTYSGQTRKLFTSKVNLSTGDITDFHPKAQHEVAETETDVTYGKIVNSDAVPLKRPSNCIDVKLVAVRHTSIPDTKEVLGVIGVSA